MLTCSLSYDRGQSLLTSRLNISKRWWWKETLPCNENWLHCFILRNLIIRTKTKHHCHNHYIIIIIFIIIINYSIPTDSYNTLFSCLCLTYVLMIDSQALRFAIRRNALLRLWPSNKTPALLSLLPVVFPWIIHSWLHIYIYVILDYIWFG